MMQDVIRAKSPKTDLYAGLFVMFMGGADEDLIRQIHEARKLNTKGVILFDYAHLNNRYSKTLATSVFSTKSAVKTLAQQPNQQNIKNAENDSKKQPQKKKKKGFLWWGRK